MNRESGRQDSRGKKVLFVTYGGSHVRIARYLWEELSRREGVEPKILALSVAWKPLQEAGVPYTVLSEYLKLYAEEERREILETGRRLAETAFNPQSDFPYEELTAYLGLSYRDLEASEGAESAAELYAARGRKAFCPTGVMEKILRYERPDAVVVSCVVRMEKAAGIAANRLGIPVVYVPDLPTALPCHAFYRAAVCVMNEYTRDYFIRHYGAPPESLTVTGQPIFEYDLIVDEEELARCRAELNRDAYRRMVVYFEQPELREAPEVEAALVRLAAERPDTLFVVKQHPNQTEPFPESVPKNVVYLRHFPLKPLLYLCDIAITRNSTTGMEAALVGKPLICVLLSEPPMYYSDYGIGADVHTLSELPGMLDACLDPSSEVSRKLAQGREQFQNHPHAAANVSDVILNEIQKSRSGMDL